MCPLRFGAGLKGKIGEAMVHGVPVVSTSVGTQGMQPVVGDEIFVADEPQAFAAAVAELFADEAAWRRLSVGGREFIERHFGFDAVSRRLDEIFGDLQWLPVRRLAPTAAATLGLRVRASDWLEQHVLWRWRA
ncbi:hypothetical protein CLD22_26380 [Rubrivivax gelatinosus]|nr:hypothetical protein [Rubrivivax gelatinosus]